MSTVDSLYSGLNWEPTFVPYGEVSGASGIFLVGMVQRNRAAEHSMATFSELSIAVHWWERLSRG